MDITDKALTLVLGPFEDFINVVRTLSSSLDASMLFMNGFVEFVTRTSFCSFKKDPTDYFTSVQKWIGSLMTNVGHALSFLKDLKGHLQVLNKFKDLMKSGIFNVFKKFKSIIKGVLKFADILSFITVLADFELCYPIPQKCEKTIKINLGFKKIKIKIPWVSTILSLDLTLSELTCITQHHFMFDTIDPDSRFQICWGTKVRRISILGLA